MTGPSDRPCLLPRTCKAVGRCASPAWCQANAEALAALRRVYEAYEAAPLGKLNETAEALREACRAHGWEWGCRVGPRQWARQKLGLD